MKSGGFYGASFSKIIIMTEVWKDIEGYEGLYQVSNLGRLKRLYKTKEFILKPRIKKCGYDVANLFKDKKGKDFKMHRLVASAFLNKEEYQCQVNHKNKIRHDNRVENLEWVSEMENTGHSALANKKSSKYIGVRFHSRHLRWYAHIQINKKQIHLGVFDTEEEAHQARVNFELNNNIINKYNGKNAISI